MTLKGYLITAAGLALVVAGLYLWHGHQEGKQVAAHVAQETQHHQAAITAAASGAVYDQHVQTQAPKIQADAAPVARLQAEVARLRAAAAHPSVPNPVPGVPEPEPAAPPVESPDLATAKDQLIDALTKANGDLKVQVVNLTQARDAWRESATQALQAETQAHLALVAQQGVTRAAELKGFIYGFGTGLVAGHCIKF